MFNKFDKEVKAKWGKTSSYQEFYKKSKNYSKEEFDKINNGLMDILKDFSFFMKNDIKVESEEVQEKVAHLQKYITEYYYTCTNEILYGLGQMYVADERFKSNIDSNGLGSCEYIRSAIEVYCK